MKRRQRRQVLDINGEQSDSPQRHWQNKYDEIPVDESEQNGGPSNPLSNLLEQYNSDSETEDSRNDGKKLDDKVNDFLKEIQLIAPKVASVENFEEKPNSEAQNREKAPNRVPIGESSTLWQECFDDSTGYPYYWHVRTNEVTWEVPEEIRLLRERNQQESLNRTSYSTQWVNFSANTYPQPQINIPEGMIPKEVVARNRNRQVNYLANSQQALKTEPNTSKDSLGMDEESDDGKIEMITSFPSDGSESEMSETDSATKDRYQEKRKTGQTWKSLLSTCKKPDNNEKSGKIGPSLPTGVVPLIHGPENSGRNDGAREKWRTKVDDERKRRRRKRGTRDEEQTPTIPDIEISYENKKLTAQTKVTNDTESSISSKELKFSLVPGYADDSDMEDETTLKKLNVEPLFPIADFSGNATSTIVTQDGTVKKIETKYTDSGSVKIFKYHSASNDKVDNTNGENKRMKDELESETLNTAAGSNTEETRIVRIEDEPPKPNIFLDNLETPSKAFQRKRRIAFDVIPSKSRTIEAENVSKPEAVASPPATIAPENEPDHQSENGNAVDEADRKTNSPVTEKSEETSVPKVEQTGVKEITKEEIKELRKTTETIMEKLKFLSEGGQPASAVQVMAIQLQTLLAAWEARELNNNYLENWLTGTGRELECLEEAAAPPGWDCQWDRSHKRYFYRNSTSGDAQWTYPEADVIGGTEEMELCTTPPPQGQEEPCIIESQSDKGQQVTSVPMENNERSSAESLDVNKMNERIEVAVPPPPPQISNPSPPPPPRIYAEDLKKGKKRRGGSIRGTISETKRDKCATERNDEDEAASKENLVNPPLPPSPTKSAQPPLPPHPPTVPKPPSGEPLPPGVDPPDMPFAISAPSIESTMLYTPAAAPPPPPPPPPSPSPQTTNPIYAATIGDPSILDHHTALMQGQLMHYPTYHQHLHNQALIAAANRLTGQEAVQFMIDYGQVYANTRVIAKPPIKSHKETLGSAIDSFYNDIASIEKIRSDLETEQMLPVEPVPVTIPQHQAQPTEIEQSSPPPQILTDSVLKERKKKKTKLGISKKQKEVSSMVAKWQKAQHY